MSKGTDKTDGRVFVIESAKPATSQGNEQVSAKPSIGSGSNPPVPPKK